jgi:hypothetical protein
VKEMLPRNEIKKETNKQTLTRRKAQKVQQQEKKAKVLRSCY